MLRKLLLLSSIIFVSLMATAQVSPYSLTPAWYFGGFVNVGNTGGTLTFPTGNFPSSGTPTVGVAANLSEAIENSTSVSFQDGSIALYSNTMKAFDGNSQLRNFITDNTCSGSSTGGGIAFPDPASPTNAFYLINSTDMTGGLCENRGTNRYRFTGTGNNLVFDAGPTNIDPTAFGGEALTGCTDGAGGYWVVVHDRTATNTFRVWHYTASGITGPVDYSGGAAVSSVANNQSYLKISPCQDKIAYLNSGSVVVNAFDRKTGVVGAELRRVTFGSLINGVGLEFSPDGSKVFYSNMGSAVNYVNIATGTIGTVASATSWTMQLGPDGKIYCAPSQGATTVGVISDANTTPTWSTINMAAGTGQYRGLINIMWLTPETPAITQNTTACVVDFAHTFQNYFQSEVTVDPATVNWNFGDGNTDNTLTASHTYGSDGTYSVTLDFQDATCHHDWSATIDVTVACGTTCTNGTTPTAPQSDRNNICANAGGDIVLSANGTNMEWFSSSCGGTSIGTGNNLTIPAPTSTTTYFVRGNATGSGCAASTCASVTVTVIQLPSTADAGENTGFCASNGNLNAIAPSVGTGVWTVMSGGGIVADANNRISNVTNLALGTGNVFRWTVSNSCGSSFDDVTIESVVMPSTSIIGTNHGCPDASLSLSTANNAGNTYFWQYETAGTGTLTSGQGTNAVDINIGNQNGELKVSETNTGTYATCSNHDSIDIIIDNAVGNPAVAGADFNSCQSTSNLSASDPSPFTGTWSVVSGSAVVADVNDPSTAISGIAGTSVLRWTVTGTCFSDFDEISITEVTGVNLVAFSGNQDDTLCDDMNKDISVVGSGGSGNYLYHWTSSDASVNETTSSTILNVMPESAGTTLYFVEVIDNSNIGCSSMRDTVSIFRTSSQELVIPNLLTPNGDEKNDFFEVRDPNNNEIFPGIKLEVTNRWGVSVYENKSYDNSWNPKNLSDGLYYYHLKAGCGVKEYKGWVQVVR